jgi:hypothetical protein
MAGCGLGSLAFEGRSKTSQVLAATTNGTSGNQTFGITSGTSNCTYDGAVVSEKQRQAFTEVTLAQILRDSAIGRGEYVTALGQLYGCDQQGLTLFKSAMKSQFANICANGQCTEATTFLNSVESTLGHNSTLATQCKGLIPAPIQVASR